VRDLSRISGGLGGATAPLTPSRFHRPLNGQPATHAQQVEPVKLSGDAARSIPRPCRKGLSGPAGKDRVFQPHGRHIKVEPAARDGNVGLDMLDDRQFAIDLARRLAAPVLAAARSNNFTAMIPTEAAPGATRDRRPFVGLETVGRLLCGLAPLLELQVQRPAGVEAIPLSDIHHLIDVTTDPASPHRLNFSEGKQPLVDAAFLGQAILRAPTALWSSLPDRVQGNLAAALGQTRAIQPFFNNWLLFAAMIEATFARLGLPWDPARVDYALRQHEQWYVGDGMYSDGPHFRWDYYNGYVIQPMSADILSVMAPLGKPWRTMHETLQPRMARYCQILERLIAPDGSFPPIGRSLAYRCAAFQPIAQMALQRSLPSELPAGQVRAGLMAVVRRTLGGPANFDDQGWLRIGLNGSQSNLGEEYISTGSLYLCSTALLPLGLPEDAPFWSDPPRGWTQKRLWDDADEVPIDKAIDQWRPKASK
jgi:hypothetical protein